MSPARYVAFVRNIMVGRRGLTRDVLLDIFATAGADEVRSYIATGNFAFTSTAASVDEVAARVEAAIETVLVRATTRNWNTVERILRAEA